MNKKDTIYIDVEDEITAVIHKVINSKAKLVVLVLPKRASVFHSAVNLKLLKNKAQKATKSLVLVSTDPNLMGLAGVVGINVAKNLQDKPEIPKVNSDSEASTGKPDNKKTPEAKPKETPETEDLEATDQSKSIGEFAALSAVGGAAVVDEDSDVIEFDNDAKDAIKPGKVKKLKIDKKLKVPDFGRFQKILIFGVLGVIALIALYVVGFIYMPKAKIIIQSSTSTLSSTIPITLDSTQTALNGSDTVVPANIQSVQKTVTSSPINTTGTKQIGIPASGTIVVTNEQCNPNYGSLSDVPIPAGTDFTDPNGNVYVSTQSVTLPGSSSPHCKNTTVSVPVSANGIGTGYNNPSNNIQFTSNGNVISNFPPNDMVGGPMTGGTSTTVQIVSQTDINNATKQIVAPNSTTIEQQLETAIKAAGYTPLTTTFVAATPVIAPSNTAGTQTNTVTATGTYNYTMYGAHPSDLDSVITNAVGQSSGFNATKQSILDTGSSGATFTVDSSAATSAKVTMQVSSTIGPKLNINQIKSQSAGQSNAKVINNISSIPGVKIVTIKYSPFWVTAMPHSTKKITIVLEKANGSAA